MTITHWPLMELGALLLEPGEREAVLGATLAILPPNNKGPWTLNWSLVWPAWYIVATAQGTGRQVEQS